jgi:hypothetical protein
MSNIRLGDISFVDAADSHAAFWRGPADTEAVFLCSIKSGAIADPEVREKFHALAAAAAGHLVRGSTAIAAAPPVRWYDTLPCVTCKQPQAADVLHLCGQVTELSELQLSPSGLPVVCCKVHVVGAMGVPDMPPSAPPGRARNALAKAVIR